MSETTPKSLRRGRWIDHALVQLPLLLLLGVAVPPFLWFFRHPEKLSQPAAFYTTLASSSAAVLTWYCLEQFRYFAKARRLSYVFPVNLTAFAICFAVIGLLRLPYSNVVAVLNFVSVSGISYLIAGLTRKSVVIQYIIPGGSVTEVMTEPDAFETLTLDALRQLIEVPGHRTTAIIADLHYAHDPQWEEWIAEAAIRGIPVYHYRQILEMQTGQVRIDHLRENNLGSLIPNLAYTGLKRVTDILFSALLIPVITPLLLVVALLIKLDSPGPALFRQQRIGFRGTSFCIHKFRSMRVRAAPEGEEDKITDAITQSEDARVTRIGAFIRRYRIDELPQIINILKGEMSWIGPRPEAESLSFLYQQQIPFYRYRHIVRPGITGWAQVNQGHVAAVDEVIAKLSFDFYYVRNISFWLDLLIVLKTVRIILGGFGAK